MSKATDTMEKDELVPGPLTVVQYEQLHEMRREYNRFIFQAPTIVVAVVAGTLALFSSTTDFFATGITKAHIKQSAELFIVLSGFILVISYWALRSRVLLRSLELTLYEYEGRLGGHPEVASYPFDINKGLRWWERGPSTLFIVVYLMVMGVLFMFVGLLGFILRI